MPIPSTLTGEPQFDQEYYDGVIAAHGYDRLDFSPLDFALGGLTNLDLRQRWLCHHQGDVFQSLHANDRVSRVVTGIGMSGPPHLGTVAQLLRAITLQTAGLDVEVVLGDLDAYNARKRSLSEVTALAARYRSFAVALGFDLAKGAIRIQSASPDVALEAARLARYARDGDFVEAEERMIRELYVRERVYTSIDFPIKYAMLLMSADISSPRLQGVANILVMTGLEEHKYVRLAQKLLKSADQSVHIAGLYSRILPGLNGYPKMSKSIPQSGIHAGLAHDEIAQMIRTESQRRDGEGLSPVLLMMAMASRATAADMNAAWTACRSAPDTWEAIVDRYIEYQQAVFGSW